MNILNILNILNTLKRRFTKSPMSTWAEREVALAAKPTWDRFLQLIHKETQ